MRLVAAFLISVLGLIQPVMAQETLVADVSSSGIVLTTVEDPPGILQQALRIVSTGPAAAPQSVFAARGQLPTVPANPDRNKFLLAGLVGVGVVVVGALVFKSGESSRFGELSGRQTTGIYMMTLGGTFAGWGFWKASR